VLLATNKYPFPLVARSLLDGEIDGLKKGVYESEWTKLMAIRDKWTIPNGARTLECQLMDICDDIAYASHDIEDGIRAGKIKYAELKGAKEARRKMKDSAERGVSAGHDHEKDELFDMEGYTRQRILDAVVDEIKTDARKGKIQDGLFPLDPEGILGRVEQVIGVLIREWEASADHMHEDAVHASAGLQKSLVRRFTARLGIIEDDAFEHGWYRVTFVDESGKAEDMDTLAELHVLKRLAYRTIVRDLRVERLQYRGRTVINGLWDVFSENPAKSAILPPEWKVRFDETVEGQTNWWYRLVADYIAGMTDTYAERLYRELCGSGGAGSIYEIESE
jgi:dGTPase